MTHTPTPEEFLSQAQPDEAELPDPLESIADSLRRLVTRVEQHDAEEAEDDLLRTNFDQLDQAYADLQAQLDEVLAICKPSTSKLANSIRAVFEPVAEVEEPDNTTVDLQPANDAPVEEWREYARSRGFEVLDTMNRSQIRTQLGIPHND